MRTLTYNEAKRYEGLLRAAACHVDWRTELPGPPYPKGRPFLLTVSGVNGAGKTTLVDLLNQEYGPGWINLREARDFLDEEYVQLRRRTEQHNHDEGSAARRDIERATANLLNAARLTGGRARLIKRLVNGGAAYGCVCLERYIWDTMAHQHMAGMSVEEFAFQTRGTYLLPDAAVILLCDPDVAQSRSEERRKSGQDQREFTREVLERRNAAYRDLAQFVPNRIVVDTSAMSAHEVAVCVADALIRMYPAVPRPTGDEQPYASCRQDHFARIGQITNTLRGRPPNAMSFGPFIGSKDPRWETLFPPPLH